MALTGQISYNQTVFTFQVFQKNVFLASYIWILWWHEIKLNSQENTIEGDLI